MNFSRFARKGFTLIELLVVIAVLGVLAAIVLLAVDPAEQLARGRDASRISAVTQVGRALQAYYTAQGASYPPAAAAWIVSLTTSKDLPSVIPQYPSNTAYGACATNVIGTGYCYNATGVTDAVVYARLESQLYKSKCAATQTAYWAFASANARACQVCTNVAELAVGASCL